MIPKKVYISVVVWDEGRKYDFLEVRERPYQTTDTQCHWCEYTDLSQVWHDASEEPNKSGGYILFEYISNRNELKYFAPFVTKNTYGILQEFEKYGKCRWAYISDLLPKGGEK